MQSHQKYKGRIVVIGAGVSGLTTSPCLLRDGFKVTLVAEKFAKSNNFSCRSSFVAIAPRSHR
jgi:glycine/D-amino acid oxidase-like deaminating enzyme